MSSIPVYLFYSDVMVWIIVFLVFALLLIILGYLWASRKQPAPEILVQLESDIQALLVHLHDTHPDHTGVKTLCLRYKPGCLHESDTTYTKNKDEIYICIKNKNKNTLMFVLLHELAHMMSESYSTEVHNEEFREHNVFLLNQARILGMYYYQNYKESPELYCGITISETPLR